MAREVVEVVVARRKFAVDRADLDPLQVVAVAKRLDERIHELELATKVVDSGRLAVMAALDVLCDMEKLQDRLDHADAGQEKRLEEMIIQLEKALAPKP